MKCSTQKMAKSQETRVPSFSFRIAMENISQEENEERPTSQIGENSSGSAFAPEKEITLFALRLSILEKAASRLSALGFVWATVVLLGGFAITLSNKDFWVVTVILLVESARIFSRSHELEWQHQSISSHGSSCALGFQRTWEPNNVPLLPYLHWVFLSKNMSFVLYWMQIVSAMVCVFLSLERLVSQDYGDMEKCEADKRNRKAALCLFYMTALSEALLFLVEKVYWVWKISFCKLLFRVSKECGFGDDGVVYMRRFFYDSYSMCINGSIFDGIKMDLISFAEDLVCSSSDHEQVMGARIIEIFVRNERFAYEILKKVGRSEKLIKRFFEILNWKSKKEREIRVLAAEVISKLAGKKHDALNLYMISGAMESIASLIYCEDLDINLLGLVILKKLARHEDNCSKIGKTHGLMPKIITFTGQFQDFHIMGLKYSLEIVNRLAKSMGSTGEKLRRKISDDIFIISNIRELLKCGEKNKELQNVGIKILTWLAMEKEARERIGGTGGVIEELIRVFLRRRTMAGDALVMLTMDSGRNCERIVKLGLVDHLVGTLKDPLLKVNSSKIMRNLCLYEKEHDAMFHGFIDVLIPLALEGAMQEEEEDLLEASIGLLSQALRLSSQEQRHIGLQEANTTEQTLVLKILSMLEHFSLPFIRVPAIRRYLIELVIQIMESDLLKIPLLERERMRTQMKKIMETTSDQENFGIFHGGVGICRQAVTVSSLAQSAMVLLS